MQQVWHAITSNGHTKLERTLTGAINEANTRKHTMVMFNVHRSHASHLGSAKQRRT
jgi:hypothetical protein